MRFVYLHTKNKLKIPEYIAIFDRYGIEVRVVEDLTGEILSFQDNAIAILKDTSNIYKYGTEVLAEKNHLERVSNVTRLLVFKLVDGQLTTTNYEYSTEGYIDLRRRQDCEVFGWDDIFVLASVGMTYHELSQEGNKISSREMVVSQFLRDNVHYKDHMNLNFHSVAPKRSIDFDINMAVWLENEYMYGPINIYASRYGLTNVFNKVARDGIFFRAAKSRRQKNYWWPGLNAGIPLTKKKDPIHEITFIVHDFCHFVLPDLIFTGKKDYSGYGKQTYVAYRMMSEAITIVLADMAFVQSLIETDQLLKATGGEGYGPYDWSLRKVYPLLRALDLDIRKGEDLKKLLKASVDYCVRGDDSTFRLYLKDEKPLLEFKEKYMPFFVEDFKWTTKNYENMVKDQAFFRDWWKHNFHLADGFDLETIESFSAKLDLSKDLVDEMFEVVYKERLFPLIGGDAPREQTYGQIPTDPDWANRRAFRRYLLGQCGLFSRHPIEESEYYRSELHQALWLENFDIAALRSFYEQYVDLLLRKNLISIDDAALYKEVFPMFEPYYVFYDEDKSYYEDLAEISKRVLAPSGC